MKKILLLLFFFNYLLSFSQAPQKINYQAIARTGNNAVIKNQFIAVEISVRDGSPIASIVYQEIDTATTNAFGLFTVSIGTGQVQVGTFGAINWSTGNKYIQVGYDQAGGSNFINMGVAELLSVPYALYAENSGSSPSGNGWTNFAVYSETQVNGITSQTVLVDSTWQIRQLNTTEDSAGTSIRRSGNQITLEPGTYHLIGSGQWGLDITNVNALLSTQTVAHSYLRLATLSNSTLLLGQGEHPGLVWDASLINGASSNPTVSGSYSIGLDGVITVLSTTTLVLQQYVGFIKINGNNSYLNYSINVGGPMGIGQNEIYTRILIQKTD